MPDSLHNPSAPLMKRTFVLELTGLGPHYPFSIHDGSVWAYTRPGPGYIRWYNMAKAPPPAARFPYNSTASLDRGSHTHRDVSSFPPLATKLQQ